jgi:hypothetical protein
MLQESWIRRRKIPMKVDAARSVTDAPENISGGALQVEVRAIDVPNGVRFRRLPVTVRGGQAPHYACLERAATERTA